MTQTHASRIRERQTPPQTISRSLISLFTLFWLFWDAAEMYSCHLKLWDIGWNTWRGSRKKESKSSFWLLIFFAISEIWVQTDPLIVEQEDQRNCVSISKERTFNSACKHSLHCEQDLSCHMDLSKLIHGFFYICCYMDLSKLIHGFLFDVTWIFKGAHFQQHLQTLIAFWTRSKILEETNGEQTKIWQGEMYLSWKQLFCEYHPPENSQTVLSRGNCRFSFF